MSPYFLKHKFLTLGMMFFPFLAGKNFQWDNVQHVAQVTVMVCPPDQACQITNRGKHAPDLKKTVTAHLQGLPNPFWQWHASITCYMQK